MGRASQNVNIKPSRVGVFHRTREYFLVYHGNIVAFWNLDP